MKRQGDKPTRFSRHLEGWQPAVVAIGMALFAVLLALPRPTTPRDLPEPRLDRSRLADIVDDERSRAQRVREAPLPFEVRAAGEALRQYGAASVDADADPGRAKLDLERAVQTALTRYGAEPLLNLRAVQTELFLDALRRWEAGAHSEVELSELGGDFDNKARANGWIDRQGRLVLDRIERWVLFRVRWGILTGLDQAHPFKPSLSEWRVYYRFLLRHPELGPSTPERDRALRQLSYVNALAKLDPGYPADFARGVLHFQAGAHAQSQVAFERHLTAYPEGRWTLRARNFWLGAATRMPN